MKKNNKKYIGHSKSNSSHENDNRYKEHNNIIWQNKFSATKHSFLSWSQLANLHGWPG